MVVLLLAMRPTAVVSYINLILIGLCVVVKSLVSRKYRNDERMQPCGTPELIVMESEKRGPDFTYCFLPVRELVIH